MTRLIREAGRRNLLGTFGIYVGGGWGVLQVIDLFIERGFLPEWVFDGALLALALVLPVVLATAWVQGGRRLAREAAEAGAPVDPVEDGGLGDILTWNRAIFGGMLAFALLGVVATGYMVMRATGIGGPGTLAAQGTFEVGGGAVLADFQSSEPDAAPSELITESLRIDLASGAAVALVDPSRVGEVLALMELDPAAPVSEDVAREIAIREGVPGVISGEVGRVGSSYVLTARLIGAESGAVLASFRQTARDADELIEAVDGLADQMRTKVGESLRSVAASESLRAVTTRSLEALRKYTYVQRRSYRGGIEADVGRQLLEEAVALDSTFASANLALAIHINNWGGSPTRAWEATAQAFRHRERLPDRERYQIEAYYYNHSGDRPSAIQAYRRMMEIDPDNEAAAINLADIRMYAGEYGEAVALLESRPSPERNVWSWNLMTSLSGLGRLEEAAAVLDRYALEAPEDASVPYSKALLYAVSGELEQARALFDDAPAAARPRMRAWAAMVDANIDVLSGSVASAREKLTGAAALARREGLPGDALGWAGDLGIVAVWVERAPERAGPEMDAVLAEVDLSRVTPRDRAYPYRALVLALAGDRAGVGELVGEYRREVDLDTDPDGRVAARIAEALVALGPSDPASWERLDDALSDDRCARCVLVMRGFGAERAGRPQDAIDAYERYLAAPFFDGGDPTMRLFATNVHERLGPLYEEIGDPEGAIRHYERFAELWRNADPELQPRVVYARARAEALRGS